MDIVCDEVKEQHIKRTFSQMKAAHVNDTHTLTHEVRIGLNEKSRCDIIAVTRVIRSARAVGNPVPV